MCDFAVARRTAGRFNALPKMDVHDRGPCLKERPEMARPFGNEHGHVWRIAMLSPEQLEIDVRSQIVMYRQMMDNLLLVST